MIKTILLTGLWLVIVPIILGLGILKFNKKGNKSVFLAWIIGLLVSFLVFELCSTPLIFAGKSFTTLKDYWFIIVLTLTVLSIIFNAKNIKDIAKKNWEEIKEFPIILTILVVLVVGAQCYVGYTYMYEDYDDSNFVAKAVITSDTDTMFVYNDIGTEYTGYPDRQVLSPFPVFTANIANLVGIHPTIMAHTIFPVVFLLLAYNVYYLLGNAVFKHDKSKTMLFLLFIALVYSFGDVTRYAASSRILFRPWQGKSILASIIIPFIIYVFIEHVGKEDDKFAWLVLLITMAGSILLSTMGVMLPAIVLTILTMLFTIKDSTFGYLYKYLICVVPNLVYAFAYLSLKEDFVIAENMKNAIYIAYFIIIAVFFIIRKFRFNIVFKVITSCIIVAFCAFSLWSFLTFINPKDTSIGVNIDGEKYAEFVENVGKQSNIFVVTDGYNKFNGTGGYTELGLFAILFITMVYFKKEHPDVAVALGIFSVITLCLPFNFYLSKIIIKVIGGEVYWRMFWLVPTTIVMPIAFTELVSLVNKNVEKIIIALMICGIVIMSGKWIYTEDNFKVVSNKYKIPDCLLEVILAASNDDEEYKKLAGPLESLVYTRQVDGNILLASGRSFNDNYGKGSLITNIKEGKVNKICAQAEKLKVNYVIMSTNAINEGIGVLNERLEDYDGVEILCKNDLYTLYKLELEEETELEGVKK